MTAAETRTVIDALEAGGATARFVGGCVRDAVLGRAVGDVDIATPATPETVTRLLEAAGIRVVPTGIGHGTVTAVTPARIEITTLRRDVETDGRHATVAFTDDWQADAARRDFTINALFCAPDGTLYDPCGGLDDLRAGRVRFVGDATRRIAEDVLRLLRFFRFYAHYGRPPPDAEALAACRAMAPLLAKLSGERIGGELLRILAAPAPAPVVALMRETGALAEVLPEAGDARALSELCALEGDEADPLRRLALLLRDADAGTVAERLKFSNAAKQRLVALTAPPVTLAAEHDAPAQRRALYRVGPDLFRDLVLLAWAEALARAPGERDALAAAYGPMLAAARAWENPKLPVKGADVVALGVPDGPAVGALLKRIEAWWEAGDYRAGRKETLARLAALVKREAKH
ncbi:MAG: CCA tRNA nucleotidyltransferase [Alphaproteobacteria bacterium]